MLASLLLIANFAFAYIPGYETIMVRVATNHGSGAYQIQRSVKWSEDSIPYEILETWTVSENGLLRVSLSGVGRTKDLVQGEINYSSEPKGFFSEQLFHLRSSKNLRQLLVRMNLAPRQSLENRPSLGTGPTVRHKPQDFMSLARVDGVITYAVGAPEKPSLFIEQDQFVITKIAFPQGPTITAKDYRKHPNSFYFPQTVTYSWGNNAIEVTTTKVTTLGKRSAESLGFGKASVAKKLPASAVINEFYSQFR